MQRTRMPRFQGNVQHEVCMAVGPVVLPMPPFNTVIP